MNMETQDSSRQLGFWMCVALVMGSMIGTGIFMVPITLAPFGLSSVSSWAVCGAGAMFLAFVFAGLSRAYPDVEGPYAYTRIAFGDLVAFIATWGYWVSLWVFNAALATGATSYLGNLLPWVTGSNEASAATSLAIIWTVTALNVRGVRTAGEFQVATTAMKLLPLLAVGGMVLWLLLRGDPQVVQSPLLQTSMTIDGTRAAATLAFSALVGFESAAVMASRVKNPERNVPWATVLGTGLTALIYIVTCTAVMLILPAETLAKSGAPFADVATQFWGTVAGHWTALFVVISAVGCLNATILMQGELPLQMARRGAFPAVFLKQTKRLTPAVALSFSSGLSTILVLMTFQKSMANIYAFMVTLATTATLVLYLLCALSLLWLLHQGKVPGSRAAKLGLALSGLIGSVFALWSFAGSGGEAVAYGFVLLGAAVPVFFLMRRFGAIRAPA